MCFFRNKERKELELDYDWPLPDYTFLLQAYELAAQEQRKQRKRKQVQKIRNRRKYYSNF